MNFTLVCKLIVEPQPAYRQLLVRVHRDAHETRRRETDDRECAAPQAVLQASEVVGTRTPAAGRPSLKAVDRSSMQILPRSHH
jgi:hypothetical protein